MRIDIARAAELLRARRGDVVSRDEGIWLHVHGKGARNRLVPVPRVALAATERYFEARGLVWGAAHPHTPLLAVLARPELQRVGRLRHCQGTERAG